MSGQAFCSGRHDMPETIFHGTLSFLRGTQQTRVCGALIPSRRACSLPSARRLRSCIFPSSSFRTSVFPACDTRPTPCSPKPIRRRSRPAFAVPRQVSPEALGKLPERREQLVLRLSPSRACSNSHSRSVKPLALLAWSWILGSTQARNLKWNREASAVFARAGGCWRKCTARRKVW